MDKEKLDSMFESFKENILSYLYMLSSDFEEVNDLINTLKNYEPFDLDVRNATTTQNALNIAVVISYARNFKRSFGFYNFSEINSRLIKDFEKEEIELHKEIIRERDKEFAHSDASSLDIQIYSEEFYSHSIKTPRMILEKNNLKMLSEMVGKIREQINAQLSYFE